MQRLARIQRHKAGPRASWQSSASLVAVWRGGRGIQQHRRAGSTLMIVMVLLGLLSVLGVLFYVFAAGERSNSENYAQGAKVYEDPGLTVEEVMNFGLQQVTIGTDPRLKNSALWGSRHALLPNALGLRDHMVQDRTAFDGEGVHVVLDMSGRLIVDQNYDGSPDTGPLLDPRLAPNDSRQPVRTQQGVSDPQDLLNPNDSPAANNLFERETGRFPQPDVDYTYPDINNMYLAYKGYVRDRVNGLVRPVIIPSFHRPQLLRDDTGHPVPLCEDFNYNGQLDAGEDLNGNGQLDYGALQINRLFRPHPNHRWVPPSTQPPSAVRRFIHTAAEAQSLLGDGKRVFPFVPMYPGYNPTSNGTTVTLNAPPGWIGHQGLWSGPHPQDPTYNNPTLSGAITSAPSLHDEYQYDVDNDGDGIREGIWLDLNYPVKELPDGTLYTLLYSFTIYDLDSLLNLNVHGNIQKLLFRYPDVPFDNTFGPFGRRNSTSTFEFISASNLGMMPAEVNPAWALTGRPGVNCSPAQISTIFGQHRLFFGNLPTNALTLPDARRVNAYRETANMELAFLKFGRPQLTPAGSLDDLYPGLYGEEHLIARYLGTIGARDPRYYPHPGVSNADDNHDQNDFMQTPPLNNGAPMPTWLEVEQPYDALGIGSYLQSGNPKQFDRVNPGTPTSRVRWLRYTDYASNGNVFWGYPSIQSGNLMRVGPPPYNSGGQAYGLFDDPSEVALWPYDRRDVDDPFDASEAAWLHLSNSDITNLNIPSRLQKLAPFNFATSSSENDRGEEIRQRFTTLANDRKSYGLPRLIGSDGYDWLWTDDQGNNTPQASHLRFPPTFGNPGAAIPRYFIQNSPRVEDPFRQAVRYLLQATRDDLVVRQYQQRLSVNQLLVYENNQLVYRDLTPHPLDPGPTPVPTNSTYTQTTPRPDWATLLANPGEQEYWARRDRQMLARDIYVLLYLLGTADPGSSLSNPTRTSWSNPYSPEQLRQMAQFAVNLVDAQDRDNVITRFEYDTNLSNGWNLDDNPYTSSGESDRAEVWGVERQELALSELLIVNVPQSATPRNYTSWDDSEDRQFFCVELRNVAPYDIKFTDNENWQLLIRQEPNTPTPPDKWRRLTLRHQAGVVPAGGFYTLFSTDRNEPSTNPSVMRVDPNGGAALQPIVPSDTSGVFLGNASPTGNFIDLVKEYQQNAFRLTDGSGSQDLTNTPGALLSDAGMSLLFTDLSTPVEVILLRRAHPTRTRPTNSAQEDDNPWIEVDRIAAEIKNFSPATNTPAAIAAALDSLQSRERREILARTTEQDANPSTAATDYVWNTLKAGSAAENSESPPVFEIIQHHPDRPFLSLGELLHVPLFGPEANRLNDPNYGHKDGLTVYFEAMRFPPLQDHPSGPRGQYNTPQPGPALGLSATDIRWKDYAKSAAGIFFAPDHPTQGTIGTIDPAWDNRWYRLLEFLEIPTRQHKNLGMGSTLEIKRQAGKLNLNTLRYPEVLAGLFDDESVCDLAIPTAASSNPRNDRLSTLFDPSAPLEDTDLDGLLDADQDRPGWIDHNWFEQLQWSRDPLDRLWATYGRSLALPGLPGSQPFRSFSFSQGPYPSWINHTLLRDLPADADTTYAPPPPDPRNLFEVGTLSDHNGDHPLDPMLRYRILSKIWGNTTVRSNTFVVFVSAKMFRVAIEPGTGAVRIGGPVREYNTPYQGQPDLNPEQPEYRGVFVIDRSRLEEALEAEGGTGITSFVPFVVHRQILDQ